MHNSDRDQSRGEEIANSITHGMALVAAVFGAPFLILNSAEHGNNGFNVGSTLFAASVITLYFSSTLYHALQNGKAKRIFRDIEHSAIFLLIAGTYTPITLGVLRGAWGWTLLGIIWSLAAVGVVMKLSGRLSRPIFSTSLYLLMGWVVIVAAGPLFEKMEPEGLVWLVAGGLSYTAGIAFFANDSRLRYGHMIWHLFVIAGTVCHYFAVLWYAY